MIRAVMYQLVAVVCSVHVFENGEFSTERVDVAMHYGVADGNARLTSELCVHQWHSISKIIVPSTV